MCTTLVQITQVLKSQASMVIPDKPNFHLRPGLRKGQWTFDEDELLRQMVEAQLDLLRNKWQQALKNSSISENQTRTPPLDDNNCNWKAIEAGLGTRTSKQCRERWFNHLSTKIKRSPYTTKEDEAIITLHNALGNQWASIAADPRLDGRTEDMVKIRWRTLNRYTSTYVCLFVASVQIHFATFALTLMPGAVMRFRAIWL